MLLCGWPFEALFQNCWTSGLAVYGIAAQSGPQTWDLDSFETLTNTKRVMLSSVWFQAKLWLLQKSTGIAEPALHCTQQRLHSQPLAPLAGHDTAPPRRRSSVGRTPPRALPCHCAARTTHTIPPCTDTRPDNDKRCLTCISIVSPAF